jgi:hypothetical protein
VSQHYPHPQDVAVPPKWWPTAYGVRKMKEIIDRDGLIVPILVYKDGDAGQSRFVVADAHQAERVMYQYEPQWYILLDSILDKLFGQEDDE